MFKIPRPVALGELLKFGFCDSVKRLRWATRSHFRLQELEKSVVHYRCAAESALRRGTLPDSQGGGRQDFIDDGILFDEGLVSTREARHSTNRDMTHNGAAAAVADNNQIALLY